MSLSQLNSNVNTCEQRSKSDSCDSLSSNKSKSPEEFLKTELQERREFFCAIKQEVEENIVKITPNDPDLRAALQRQLKKIDEAFQEAEILEKEIKRKKDLLSSKLIKPSKEKNSLNKTIKEYDEKCSELDHEYFELYQKTERLITEIKRQNAKKLSEARSAISGAGTAGG